MEPFAGLFGDDRVAALMAQGSPNEGTLLDPLLIEVRAFEAGGPQSDDIAAVPLKLEDRAQSGLD